MDWSTGGHRCVPPWLGGSSWGEGGEVLLLLTPHCPVAHRLVASGHPPGSHGRGWGAWSMVLFLGGGGGGEGGNLGSERVTSEYTCIIHGLYMSIYTPPTHYSGGTRNSRK